MSLNLRSALKARGLVAAALLLSLLVVASVPAVAAAARPVPSLTPERAPGVPVVVHRGGALAFVAPAPAFAYPIAARKVDYGTGTNGFGAQRGGHVHSGQDIFAAAGTPLRAVADGVVVEAGSDGGRGNHVAIHSRAAGQTFSYFHMQSAARVAVGDRVRAGQRVGAVGCSGSCSGDHLHFEVHRGRGALGAGIDPMPLLRRWRAAR